MSAPNFKKKCAKKDKDVASIPFTALFRFATKRDYLLMVLGTIGAAVDGATMPFLGWLLGDVTDSFAPGHSGDELVDAAATIAWKFCAVGVVSFISSYIGFACWMIVGEQQSIEIRKRYFKSLLSQEIGFFDSINPNELSTKIAEECLNIQQGIGEKVPNFVNSLAITIGGFVIGYTSGWQLALVLTAFIPVMIITGAIFAFTMQKVTRINNEAYSKVGAISEEVLSAIRTVVSLGGQERETARYQKVLNENNGPIVKYSIIVGMAMGVVFMSIIGVFALAFYVGSLFIENQVEISADNYYTGGTVLTIFFSIIQASLTPTRTTPAIKAFAIARTAGARAFKIIDRKSKISPEDPRGLKPKSIEGNISFKNVVFAYPLKPDRTVLNGINFDIRKNEKTALVGESGCGKTTCLQLIERFYDIENGSGSIQLDGNELKELNLKWMRENIGYVGQEPVLFATSIKENLMMAKEDATEEEVWDALKKANAYDFVQSLPDKLNTFVGTNGAQLSGGQKQRLAIARAILKNPKILLLDEATSALDRKNEMEIQKTLDEVSEGRTTIVIAHRLTTIQNADHIVVFDQGKVVEEGNHQQLVARKGRYYALQHLQLEAEEKEKKAEEKDSLQEIKLAKNIDPLARKQSKKLSSAQEKDEMDPQTSPIDIVVDNSQHPSLQKSKPQPEPELQLDIWKRLFKYNKEDLHLIIIGVSAALVQGCVFPSNAVLLANMLEIFAMPSVPNFRERANLYSILFLVLAAIAFVSNAIRMACFNLVAERLSRKIRADVFKKYVRMPIGWFDLPENSPGALGSKLSTDAALLNTLTGSVFGVFVETASSLATGVIISFIGSWQLSLVGLALFPLQIFAGKLRAKLGQGYVLGNDAAYQGSIAFVSEAVNNMRTVVSFGKEEKLLMNYSNKLNEPLKAAVKNGHLSGIAFGFGQLATFVTDAVIFYVGAIFMRDLGLGFKDMFMSVLGIMFAAMGIGSALQFSPDIGAAKAAAVSVFKILDTKPAIDIDDPNQTVRNPIRGDIEFKNVWFKYPSREKQIFKGLNLKINASNKVALVGPSGCGKSTILALLQRFYDPDQGEVLIDGVNVKNYDLKHLRESFGVVSQEPVLFNGSIEYNIKYSKRDATDEEMKEAARKANALGFIEKNEFDMNDGGLIATNKQGTGFQKMVGPKGSQLSGGQKQRIAIARAILKNPSFLILDEATSALDAENEKAVQVSLDAIMQGKTSLIVAHRISTIKDSDEIIVFNDGEIVERGNYQKLIDMKGMFYKLEKGVSLA